MELSSQLGWQLNIKNYTLRISSLGIILWGLFFSCFITSCDTENVGYHSKMIQLPTQLNLSDVYFVNQDTGYITAGGLFTAGLVLGTTNGGTTWDTVFATGTGANSISYQNGFLSVSECGQQFYTSTNLNNWSFSNATEGWWNWHKHIRLTDNRILLVGGENFGRGFIHIKEPNQSVLSLKSEFVHELRDIVVTPNRTIHVVGYGLVMKSTDEGLTWIKSSVVGDFFQGVDFVNNNVGYVLGEYGSVYKTTDRGDSWSQCRGGNSVFANMDKLLRDIAFENENTGFLVGSGNQVFRTTDGGKIWKLITHLDGYADFNAISIFNNKAYVLGNNGKLLVINL